MSQEITIPNTEVSFKDFLFKNKRNRTILWIAAAAIVIQWAAFKYFYPFASYIHGDSFSYINAASRNFTINTYLIGYSKFLRLVSVFAKPDYILVTIQFLFITCSVFYLLFTIFYFYQPGKNVQLVLLCFMAFNPLFWHLGNMISSDGIFLGLSMNWFALLLWIIHSPSKKNIIWHAIVIFLAFTFRYNAIIYPVISLVAFSLSKIPLRQKVAGFGLGVTLCFLFVCLTSYQYKRVTGYWQYSPFSGWQLANNAMYAYRYVDSANRKPVAQKYKALDKLIRDFFDSTRDIKKFPSEQAMASTYYMWTPSMPLFTYRNELFKNDTVANELKKWASMGPFYKSYGTYIISKYPWHFIRYFMWPNANKYYAPPVEFLSEFNSKMPTVSKQAKVWFGYKSDKIGRRMKGTEILILNYYPILSGAINIVMICTLLCYLSMKGWYYDGKLNKAIIMGSSLWLVNAGFTIAASSAALRFQSFPLMLTCIFTALLINWMIKLIPILKQDSIRLKDKNTTEGAIA
jgi:hypothetical protein